MRYSQTQKPPLGTLLNLAHPLSKGLVGLWLMNEGSGDKIYDRATMTGMPFVGSPTWNPGGVATSLNNYIYPFKGPAACNNATMLCRVNVASAVDYASFIQHRIPVVGNDASGVMLRPSYELGYNWNSLFWYWSSGITVPTNTWVDVALTVTPTVGKVYLINAGSVSVATNNDSHLAVDLYQMAIGADPPPQAGRSMNGTFKHVFLYNRALSAQEVWQLYTTPYAMFERRPVWMDYVAAAGGLSIPLWMQQMDHFNGGTIHG